MDVGSLVSVGKGRPRSHTEAAQRTVRSVPSMTNLGTGRPNCFRVLTRLELLDSEFM